MCVAVFSTVARIPYHLSVRSWSGGRNEASCDLVSPSMTSQISVRYSTSPEPDAIPRPERLLAVVLSVPDVPAEDVGPPVHLLPVSGPERIDLFTAFVAADLANLLDFAHHVRRQPNRQLFFVCDGDGRLWPGCK